MAYLHTGKPSLCTPIQGEESTLHRFETTYMEHIYGFPTTSCGLWLYNVNLASDMAGDKNKGMFVYHQPRDKHDIYI